MYGVASGDWGRLLDEKSLLMESVAYWLKRRLVHAFSMKSHTAEVRGWSYFKYLVEELKYHGSQYQMENVARGEMTTITYVYKKKTLYIFKAPKKSKFLNILVLEVGVWSWKSRIDIFYCVLKTNRRLYPGSWYQIVHVARGEMTTRSYVNKKNT